MKDSIKKAQVALIYSMLVSDLHSLERDKMLIEKEEKNQRRKFRKEKLSERPFYRKSRF